MLRIKKLNVETGEVNTITFYEVQIEPAIDTEEKLLSHSEIQPLIGDGYCRSAFDRTDHWICEMVSPSPSNRGSISK